MPLAKNQYYYAAQTHCFIESRFLSSLSFLSASYVASAILYLSLVLPLITKAKCGSAEIILKPAPRGVGLAASATVRNVLELAGVKDMWTFASGRTRDKYNMALATYEALKKLNELKNLDSIKQ